jgi:hypothetical protein
MAVAIWAALELKLMTRGAMNLLQVLLAGFLRWAGLPPADLKLVRDALCCVPGAMELAQFARRRAEERE